MRAYRYTWVNGLDAIGEGLGAARAEILRQEREPRGEKLRSGSEIGWSVVNEKRVGCVGTVVVGLRLSLLLLFHGAESTDRKSVV